MERFFTDPNTPKRFRSGPLGSHVDQFANDLFCLGDTRKTIRYHLRIVDHFGRWLKRRRRITTDITDEDVRHYVDQRGCVRNGDASAIMRMVELLRERGIVRTTAGGVLTPVQEVIQGFSCYLQQERALALPTITNYRRYASAFLRARFGDGKIDLSLLTAENVIDFVRIRAGAARSEAIKNVTPSAVVPGLCAVSRSNLPELGRRRPERRKLVVIDDPEVTSARGCGPRVEKL
jgi:hypothetical protein